jgi:hypothetical protein
VTLVMYMGGGLGVVSLPGSGGFSGSSSGWMAVKRLEVIVGFNQCSLGLACLKSLLLLS